MPQYSYECPVHGPFEVTVPMSRHQDHPPCPWRGDTEIGGVKIRTLRCQEVTVQTYTPSRPKDWAISPVVIHVGKDGALRFPGHANARVPKNFERVELKTLGEIEAFERKTNSRLSYEREQHLENEERHFAAIRDKARSELRQRMQSMSQFGRDFAQFCIDENNRRRRKSSDVGFHLQILHQDASNREPFRPDDGYKPVRWI